MRTPTLALLATALITAPAAAQTRPLAGDYRTELLPWKPLPKGVYKPILPAVPGAFPAPVKRPTPVKRPSPVARHKARPAKKPAPVAPPPSPQRLQTQSLPTPPALAAVRPAAQPVTAAPGSSVAEACRARLQARADGGQGVFIARPTLAKAENPYRLLIGGDGHAWPAHSALLALTPGADPDSVIGFGQRWKALAQTRAVFVAPAGGGAFDPNLPFQAGLTATLWDLSRCDAPIVTVPLEAPATPSAGPDLDLRRPTAMPWVEPSR